MTIENGKLKIKNWILGKVEVGQNGAVEKDEG